MALGVRRRTSAVFVGVLTLIAWLLTSGYSAAQQSPRPVDPAAGRTSAEPRRILRVAVDDNYPPYIFRDDRGELDGYLPDIWRLWSERTGVAVEIIASDWAKALALMESGGADVIDTLFRTPAREAIYDFSTPYADIPVSIYSNVDISGLTSVESLRGLVVGAKNGDACVEHLLNAGITTLELYDSYQKVVDAAAGGRLRVFCLDNPPANFLLYRAGALSKFRQAFPLYSGAFHRAVRKGDAATLALVERGFAAIPPEAERTLRDKWTGATPQRSLTQLLLYILSAGAAGGALSLAVIWILRREVARRTRELEGEKLRLRTLIDSLPDLVWMKDASGVYLACNAAFEKFFGAREADIVGRTDYHFVSKELADFFRDKDRQAAAKGGPNVNEEEVTYASDGRTALLETIKTPTLNAEGQLVGVLGIGRDITERRRQDHRLQLAARVFESTADAVVISDADGRIVAINRAFTAITGYGESEASGKRLDDLLTSGRHPPDFFVQMAATLGETGRWRGEIWSRRKNGEIFPEWRTISVFANDRGDALNYVSVFSDITPVKRSQEALDFLAYHDTLTGLPNRAYFLKRLDETLAAIRRSGGAAAALFVDLDGFKHVNDSLGHPVGDELLRAVGAAMRARLGDDGVVARLGGDEFVILAANAGAVDLARLAGDVNRLFDRPFTVLGRDLYVSASVGVAVGPRDGDDADTLLRHADLAMYAAKTSGKNTFRFYQPAMGERAVNRQRLENALRGALRRGELFLLYQPQYNLDTRRPVGVEALARWRSPEFGLVPPDQFIPLAEENGAILEIGAWVVREACRQLAEWRARGIDAPRMAINLSTQQIKHGRIVELLASACAEAGVPPADIELEVTESMAMDHLAADGATLKELRALGVALSIDDFGAGHSSLGRLRRLPVHRLKIDRSFIADIGQDRDDEAIVSTIIALGKSLGLEIIAEGVETEEQAAFLRQAGCELAQGWLFAKALPADEAGALFR